MTDDTKTILPPEVEAAGIIAPVVRGIKGRKRIHVTKGDTNEVVGVIDDQQLVVKMLERKGVEFGVSPEPGRCAKCGKRISKRIERRIVAKRGKDAVVRCRKCALMAGKVRVPCSICGEPSMKGSSDRKRTGHSRVAYCDRHRNARADRLACATCGLAATIKSEEYARTQRAKGRTINAYCKAHGGAKRRARGPLPCAKCGRPSTASSTLAARSKVGIAAGHKAYCKDHPWGRELAQRFSNAKAEEIAAKEGVCVATVRRRLARDARERSTESDASS